MAVDIDKLLSLPQRERRRIAKKLWDSLTPGTSHMAITKKEKEVISLLETRWQDIQTGKAKLISSDSFWNKMEVHLSKKKR